MTDIATGFLIGCIFGAFITILIFILFGIIKK